MSNTMEQQRDQVFISYSHKDREWLDKLITMLKPLIRNQIITVWDDTKIQAGSKWKDEIQKALAAAKVAVLMVSPNFLASDFIAKHELPPLLRAAEQEGLTIIWICISACLYEETEIVDYQSAHNISQPLDSLSPSELGQVLKAIGKQVKEATNKPTVNPSVSSLPETDSTELVSQPEVLTPERLAEIDNQYLEYQGNTCQDYQTEGQPLQSFIPQLGEVFVPLELTDFLSNYQGDRLLMPPGFHWHPETISSLKNFPTLIIWDLLKETQKTATFRQLVILALGGYGKTTLLHHVTYIYTQKKQRRGVPNLLPVLIRLRDWQQKIAEHNPDLPIFIEQFHLPSLPPQNKTFSFPPEWALNHLNQGKMLILLDGFDEVRPEWREPVSEWIATQIENYRNSCFILTSRPAGYKDFPAENKRFTGQLFIKHFNPKQQEDFIRRWYLCQESYARGGKKDGYVKTIANDYATNLLQQLSERDELAALAKNPLMLNMIVHLHRYHSYSSGGNLPQRRAELYRDIMQLQLWDRPRAKRIEMLLEFNKSKQVLQGLALFMVQENTPEMNYQDIITAITPHLQIVDDTVTPSEFIQQIEQVSELLVKKDDRYEFAHLNFQGYLAAAEIERTKQEDLLLQHYSESWWKETILLYVAQLRNPSTFIRCLISLSSSEAIALAYECLKETPRQVDKDVAAQLQSLSKTLQDARYQKLEELLRSQQWKDADYETYHLMIETVGKEDGQWFYREDIENFPCEDLRTIDQLWVTYSNGHFGFSVQKNIWLEVGGQVDYDTECKLGDRLGWRKGGEWTSYGSLRFDLSAPPGHLPGRGWKVEWGEGLVGGVGGVGCSSLAQRVVTCRI